MMVRRNLDLWVLASSKSEKDRLAVAEELSSYASPDEISDMWLSSTAEPYSYFVVNLMSKIPALRFTRNFDEAITHENKK